MLYDYIIIGAGFAGLICYKKLKEINPKYNIIILEKNNHIGGRMNTEKFYGVNISNGAGMIRKNKDKLMMNLLHELKIDYHEYDVSYDYKVKKIDIKKCIDILLKNYKNQNTTFQEYGEKILGKSLYKDFVKNIGYSDFNKTDIHDVLYDYGLEDAYTNYTGV